MYITITYHKPKARTNGRGQKICNRSVRQMHHVSNKQTHSMVIPARTRTKNQRFSSIHHSHIFRRGNHIWEQRANTCQNRHTNIHRQTKTRQ